jgi:dethiobiotin synthetase
MRPSGLFITGTDTDVGKTVATAIIALALHHRGVKVGMMKPIATGGRWDGNRLISPDAEYLKKILALEDDLELINPICLELPLAPLVAAKLIGTRIDLDQVWKAYEILRSRYEFLIVEGIGGLMVPIFEGFMVADLAKEFALPLVIIARPGLGTINHTLLTIQCARYYNLTIQGFIFNNSKMTQIGLAELTNHQTIEEIGQIPFWGNIPFLDRNFLENLNLRTISGKILEEWIKVPLL